MLNVAYSKGLYIGKGDSLVDIDNAVNTCRAKWRQLQLAMDHYSVARSVDHQLCRDALQRLKD